jgi:tetraprenyl-beta-curcumene synthase
MHLSPRQTAVLLLMAWRELTWGLRSVNNEVTRWRRHAECIPSDPIRRDALAALHHKRPHLDGAALFSALPTRRHLPLLRALVRYELILEFLDNLNERFADVGLANARQLHLALAEAVDIDGPVSDYYRYMPSCDDGGFLRRLVKACRRSCEALAGYHSVQALILHEARLAGVLALNHEPDPTRRNELLRQWSTHYFGENTCYSWFELTGAATSSLTVHMLLAQAAEPSVYRHDIWSTHFVYFPHVALLSTMLDSYIDGSVDVASSHHSYFEHYEGTEDAIRRLSELIDGTLAGARSLHRGHRHAVVVAAMIALYLSDDNARVAPRHHHTAQLVNAGGFLTRFLLPILRLWRIMYNLRSA